MRAGHISTDPLFPPVKKSVGEILSLFTGESLLMPLSDGHLS